MPCRECLTACDSPPRRSIKESVLARARTHTLSLLANSLSAAFGAASPEPFSVLFQFGNTGEGSLVNGFKREPLF